MTLTSLFWKKRDTGFP